MDPPGWVHLFATREAWPLAAVVEISLDYFNADINDWQILTRITALGSKVSDRHGNPVTEFSSGSRKRDPRTNLPLPFFRHVWPHDQSTRLPNLQLRVNTNLAINTRIAVDW